MNGNEETQTGSSSAPETVVRDDDSAVPPPIGGGEERLPRVNEQKKDVAANDGEQGVNEHENGGVSVERRLSQSEDFYPEFVIKEEKTSTESQSLRPLVGASPGSLSPNPSSSFSPPPVASEGPSLRPPPQRPAGLSPAKKSELLVKLTTQIDIYRDKTERSAQCCCSLFDAYTKHLNKYSFFMGLKKNLSSPGVNTLAAAYDATLLNKHIYKIENSGSAPEVDEGLSVALDMKKAKQSLFTRRVRGFMKSNGLG